jgi:hypothetical protein
MVVNGLCSATGWSQLGIESTGTNAEDTNVTGKRTVKPTALAYVRLPAIAGGAASPGALT